VNIELYIERLILDGLPIERRQRADVEAAVETELTRLLTENGLGAEWLTVGAIPVLRAEAIQLTNKVGATQLGGQIAQAVYGGIGAEQWQAGER
jgi:hypothetical protein